MTPAFHIDRHPIGPGSPVFIVAEIGATHAGKEDQALSLIDAAAGAGAQAVKLQTVEPEYSYTRDSISYPIFQELRLSAETIGRLQAAARERGLILFSTPGDFPSLDLVSRFDPPLYKVSSGLMTNVPLIRAIAAKGRPMIISSGMAHLDEIARSVRIAREAGARDVAVLHCTSTYPCPDALLNLRAIPALAEALEAPVGFSDHSRDGLACIGAVALGAVILEKHLALSDDLAGPERGTACTPEEFAAMVRDVRRMEAMRGTGSKQPQSSEAEGRTLFRRGLVARIEIPEGGRFTAENVSVMRGGASAEALTPDHYDGVIGKAAARALKAGEPIRLGSVREP